MPGFFSAFPKVRYDINQEKYTNFETVTNIFFRIGIIKEVLSNISSYYLYVIEDSDTPEILAEKFYNDPEYNWIIIYANDIVDPQFDWPLNTTQFNNYIIGKYGSLEAAKIAIHHYEKVITRTNNPIGVTTTTRFVVNGEQLTNNDMDVPYDTFESLTAVQDISNHTVGGDNVEEIISRNSVTVYDWEMEQNENKRTIRVIKEVYLNQIIGEFDRLTKAESPTFLRRLTN